MYIFRSFLCIAATIQLQFVQKLQLLLNLHLILKVEVTVCGPEGTLQLTPTSSLSYEDTAASV